MRKSTIKPYALLIGGSLVLVLLGIVATPTHQVSTDKSQEVRRIQLQPDPCDGSDPSPEATDRLSGTPPERQDQQESRRRDQPLDSIPAGTMNLGPVWDELGGPAVGTDEDAIEPQPSAVDSSSATDVAPREPLARKLVPLSTEEQARMTSQPGSSLQKP